MSNDTLVFNVCLTLNNDLEESWIRQLIEHDPLAVHSGNSSVRELFNKIVVEDGSDCWEFNASIENGMVHMYSEEFGNPKHVALVAHNLFKLFRSDGTDYCVISYAKGGAEHSGGVLYATKDGVGACPLETQIEVAKLNVEPQ